MSANSETVYIKVAQNVLVYDRNVTLGDIASVTSSNEAMVRHLKQKKVCSFPDHARDGKKLPKVQRKIFSILKLVELIHEDYPNAEIDNEGEKDFIIEYKSDSQPHRVWDGIKITVLCGLVFFGAAFTIMSFNNDIGITELFAKFYYQVMGRESSGMTELEASYCVGLAVGILVFYNHLGRKKLTSDPTPIQVQMRKYEQDVDTTYIENAGRGGEEIDVS